MIVRTVKRMSGDKRRRSILDAALSVLSSEGYAGITTARVARKVGVTEPILYRHFSSKRAILRALLDEVITRMMSAFHDLTKEEADPVTALRRICCAYPELARRYKREFRVINQALVEVSDPATHKILARHYGTYHTFLQKLIEKGQRAGTLRSDIPAAMGAWHIIHSALGFLMTQNISVDAQTSKNFESLVDVTLSGLLKNA